MTKQELVGKMQENRAWVPGKTVKLDFGDQGLILLDGAGQTVGEEDGPADTTIKTSGDEVTYLPNVEQTVGDEVV